MNGQDGNVNGSTSHFVGNWDHWYSSVLRYFSPSSWQSRTGSLQLQVSANTIARPVPRKGYCLPVHTSSRWAHESSYRSKPPCRENNTIADITDLRFSRILRLCLVFVLHSTSLIVVHQSWRTLPITPPVMTIRASAEAEEAPCRLVDNIIWSIIVDVPVWQLSLLLRPRGIIYYRVQSMYDRLPLVRCN